MQQSEIIEAVEKKIMAAQVKKYTLWTIGISNDPEQRKAEHNNPRFWEHWKADSETIARNVEKHFIDKGMKGRKGGEGTEGGGDHPAYVYIF